MQSIARLYTARCFTYCLTKVFLLDGKEWVMMNNTWVQVVFGVATIYFGLQTWRVMPTFLRLLAALVTGVVKWPGPRIHDLDPSASKVRARLGVGYENLFSTFVWNTVSLIGAFVFSALTFLSGTPMLRGYISIEWRWDLLCLVLFAFAGGWFAQKKALVNVVQVNTILSDLMEKVEPQEIDARSARSEYAIEHPLIGNRDLPSDRRRALDQFYESVRTHQDGNEFRAMNLYNEAMDTDSSLHENIRGNLLEMTKNCNSIDTGAIYYWIGLHSEYLLDWHQAALAYEKAVNAFIQIGYKNRASRACNNLGNVKMQLRDPSAMDEFEKAIALNPENGIAHISIGVTYYRISERGDPRFEKALDAFADAIVADSLAYTPLVTSRLRSIGYTWKEDLEDILQRVDKKLLRKSQEGDNSSMEHAPISSQKKGVGFDLNVPDKKTENWKAYQDEEHGFEIDIPKDWTVYKHNTPVLDSVFFKFAYGWSPDVDVAFVSGPNETLNVVVETMVPEPTPNITERFFRLYAQNMNFTDCECGRITIEGKVHTWARYQYKNKIWSKKYMIVLNKKGYAITASCNSKELFLQSEKVWDAIATSFRMKE
jgi:tetratricopeptide (TPR) repeat protein